MSTHFKGSAFVGNEHSRIPTRSKSVYPRELVQWLDWEAGLAAATSDNVTAASVSNGDLLVGHRVDQASAVICCCVT